MNKYLPIINEIIDAIEKQDIATGCSIFMEKIAPDVPRIENPDGTFRIGHLIYPLLISMMRTGRERGVDDVYSQACMFKINEVICNNVTHTDEELLAEAREQQGRRILASLG